MSDKAIGAAKAINQCSAIITGGTSGVGLATAMALAEQGCLNIAIVGRNEERGKAALEGLKAADTKCNVIFLAADANDSKAAQYVADEAKRQFGTIDILVNSVAASYVPSLLFNTDIDDILGILTGQALPAMLMCRAVLPYMREQKSGAIINIASDAAKVPTPGESVIGAGMAAIVVFTRTLAIEAKRDGIRANVLTPSLISNTPVYDRVMSDPFSAKLFSSATKLASLGVAEPEDLAGLILFLAGPGGAKLTGQAISLNGGISAA